MEMNSNLDFLINFFNQYTGNKSSELGEQEAAAPAAGGSTSTPSGKTPKKWESGRAFGKTYMNDPKYKWESGRKFGKTYMNDPKYVWKSDRVMGKTGGSDFA
jgi:hypothetical protein